MLATKLIEELESRVNEFGDGEIVLPDPLENWYYPLGSIELDISSMKYKLHPED